MSHLSSSLIFASDHAGYELKEYLKQKFSGEDLGTHSLESVDYPLLAQTLCQKVLAHPESKGVLICGTGIGMSIAANRFKGIRAARVTQELEATLAASHNHANVLCLGARITAPWLAETIIHAWLKTAHDQRHHHRIELLDCLSL